VAQQKKPRLTKEDLDARFAARQEKNRERRQTKYTREDIARLLEERKANRAQGRATSSAPNNRLVRAVSLGLGGALLLGSGALAVTTTSSSDAFSLASEANQQQIELVEGDLASIPAAGESASAQYAAQLEAAIADATAKGAEIARLQQEFATILFGGNTEVTSDGAAGPSLSAAVENRRLLAPYFVEQALLVDAAEAYAPGSALPFEADQIDPRFAWYVGYEPESQGRTVVDPGLATWNLVSVVASETTGVLDATWLNTSPTTGELFAWATASYYVESGAFGNVSVGFTTIGERYIPFIDQDGA
jgi:hypothetical protein